jgi:hypothetical protein
VSSPVRATGGDQAAARDPLCPRPVDAPSPRRSPPRTRPRCQWQVPGALLPSSRLSMLGRSHCRWSVQPSPERSVVAGYRANMWAERQRCVPRHEPGPGPAINARGRTHTPSRVSRRSSSMTPSACRNGISDRTRAPPGTSRPGPDGALGQWQRALSLVMSDERALGFILMCGDRPAVPRRDQRWAIGEARAA